MSNAVRILFGAAVILFIGTLLYESPDLVHTHGYQFHATRSISQGSPTLLAGITADIVIGISLILTWFVFRCKQSVKSLVQFDLTSILIWTAILAIPLALVPVYQSAVLAVPQHPRGDSGLPIWLFLIGVYAMLLPITYIASAACNIIKPRIPRETSDSK